MPCAGPNKGDLCDNSTMKYCTGVVYRVPNALLQEFLFVDGPELLVTQGSTNKNFCSTALLQPAPHTFPNSWLATASTLKLHL